jgi:D-serine deaminase-like pyridoxal phosphate-dependent protein
MKRLSAAVLFEVLISALALVACGPSSNTPTDATKQGSADLPNSNAGAAAPKGAALSTLDPGRFAAWNAELRLKEPGRDTVLVDLDAVDHNIAVVRATLGPKFALRLVTKSLPSTGLIRHIMMVGGTNKLMTFSEGVLGEMLEDFGWDMDTLQGRPMPVEGAERLLRRYSAAANVRWLVDTVDRAKEYAALAKRMHIHLRVAVEIDVGLRRGGAIDNADLLNILAVIDANKRFLTFAGFMGYDGHVFFGPAFGQDADAEFAAVHARYRAFVNAGAAAYPEMFSRKDLVFNSGGSNSYNRYTKDFVDTPVNDVAMGSGFVMPGNYATSQANLQALGHYPALHLATPVLKRIVPAELPFLQGYLPQLAQGDPNLEVSFFMLSGPGPSQVVYPPQLVWNPILSPGPFPTCPQAGDPLGNQALMNGSHDLQLGVGDFIFGWICEGGAISEWGSISALHNNVIVDTWDTARENCLNCGKHQRD